MSMAITRLRMADDSIQSFDIHELPSGSRAPVVERVVRFEGMALAKGKNGKLYRVAGRKLGQYSFPCVGFNFIEPMAKCLHALKMITDADLKASVDADAEYSRKKDIELTVQYLPESLEKLDLELTKGQIKKVNALLKSVGSDEVIA